MKLSRLPKHIFFNTLTTVIFIFTLSACSSEDLAKSIQSDTSSGSQEDQENSGKKVRTDIKLSWSAPSEREDNEPISLSEIAGYKVYYGTSRRKYNKKVNIRDGSADGYTFKNFSSGTYYFALTTYDTAGRESQYSTEIKIVV